MLHYRLDITSVAKLAESSLFTMARTMKYEPEAQALADLISRWALAHGSERLIPKKTGG